MDIPSPDWIRTYPRRIMEFWQIVVAIACMLYISDWLKRAIGDTIHSNGRASIEKLRKLHTDAEEELTMAFNFWWESEAREKVSTSITKDIVDQIPPSAPEALRQGIASMAPIQHIVEQMRSIAFEIAVHSRISDEYNRIVERVPRAGGLRDKVKKDNATHLAELEEESLELIRLGLNPDEIAERFLRG